MNKLKNNNWPKVLIVIASGLFVGFLIFLFIWLLNVNTFNGCATKYNMNVYFKAANNINNRTKRIDNSRVIIVGDSRMEFIEDDEEIVKPFNFEFVAKSGMTIEWFENTAMPKIKDILKNDDMNNHVVVNMGVNDLNNEDIVGDDIAKDYFNLYSQLAEDYPNVKFYILSVNPINEEKINEWENNKRTSKKVRLFNDTIQNDLEKNDLNNMYYCDSYNAFKFKTKDGLHYTQDTNREIIDYIANKCVQY